MGAWKIRPQRSGVNATIEVQKKETELVKISVSDTSSPKPSKLRTVTWFSAINGYSITVFAVLATLTLVATNFSWLGLLGGLSVALSGFVEVLGYRKLKNGDLDGLRLASLSQILVFGSILIYSSCQLMLINTSRVSSLLSPNVRQLLIDLYQIEDYMVDELVTIALKATYVSLIFASLIYQGSLLIYYQLQKKKFSVRA